nr:unnamed protein product [uncultured bacterium]
MDKANDELKNRNFVMLFRDHMPEMRWLSMNHTKAYNVLLFIMEHMDFQNALMCPNSILQDYFSVSRQTISTAIKTLKENGFIDILKVGTSNVYIVNPDVAWTNYADKVQYCKFQGNILVNKSENLDYQFSSQYDKLKALRQREGIKSDLDKDVNIKGQMVIDDYSELLPTGTDK